MKYPWYAEHQAWLEALGYGPRHRTPAGTRAKRANLGAISLQGVNLSGADLGEVNLSAADLSGADLSDVDLTGANLCSANFSGANLSGANLSDTDLWRARFSGACLAGVTWTGAGDLDHLADGFLVPSIRGGFRFIPRRSEA